MKSSGKKGRLSAAIVASLIVLLVGSPLVVRARESKPNVARFKAFKTKEPLRRFFVLPKDRKAVAAPPLIRVKIAKTRIILADVDGDGRFDEPGVDGWCLQKGRHLVPLEMPFVLGSKRVRLQVDVSKKKVSYAVEPLKGSKGILKCLETMNNRRLQNGLPTAGLDPKLCESCSFHCAYMALHGVGHFEDPAKKGYTPEGEAAGKASSVGWQIHSIAESIYASFFHRFSLTDPRTKVFGLAERGPACVDGMRGKRKRLWTWPTIIPAPGAVDQPTAFDTSEQPLAYPAGMTPGLPITLQFQRQLKFDSVQAKLHPVRRPKQTAKVLVTWPGKPANTSFQHNYNSILILPTHVLKSGTTYNVAVTYTVAGKKPTSHTWEFTTR